MPSELRLTSDLDAPAITALRVEVAAFLSANQVSTANASDILLALTEATTNAARHSGSSTADVHVVLFDHTIAVTVTDSGVGFDHERVGFSCPHPLSPDGRGLFLISSVMDSVEVTCTDGTKLRMTKHLSRVRPRPSMGVAFAPVSSWNSAASAGQAVCVCDPPPMAPTAGCTSADRRSRSPRGSRSRRSRTHDGKGRPVATRPGRFHSVDPEESRDQCKSKPAEAQWPTMAGPTMTWCG